MTTIDCDCCTARGVGCADCVVTFLLGPPDELRIDEDAAAALRVLAEGGLVPPMRMAYPCSGPHVETA